MSDTTKQTQPDDEEEPPGLVRPGDLVYWHRCIDLVSQGVPAPVPSALRAFTTRFGMERGGSSALNTHLCSAGFPCQVHTDFVESIDDLRRLRRTRQSSAR